MKVTMDRLVNPPISIQANRNQLSQDFISVAAILDYVNLGDIQQLLNLGKYHQSFFLLNSVIFM